jgi:peptidoglycan L-alanyl-D-glutamate endopeptidase CwlK
MDQKSKDKLKGVDARLVSVAELAYTYSPVKFIVTEGLRTKERQEQLVKQKASKTMNSKHLVGKAVDIAPLVEGKVRWDWPLFYPVADAFKKAALELNVPLQWGGDWRTFKDGPHFEIKE